MIKALSQGGRANQHGRTAEAVIESVLHARAPMAEIIPGASIGRTIYDGELKVDRYVVGLPAFPNGLAIESKWQELSGSVDEKFPYLVENIKTCYPCPVIIVTGGRGARPGAIRWLKRQVDGVHLIAVLTLEEFVTWCNRSL
jgi:hypothetical protein